MTLELDDEELSDIREALRLHLMRLLKDLARPEHRRFMNAMRARFERLEVLYLRLDCAAVEGPISATH